MGGFFEKNVILDSKEKYLILLDEFWTIIYRSKLQSGQIFQSEWKKILDHLEPTCLLYTKKWKKHVDCFFAFLKFIQRNLKISSLQIKIIRAKFPRNRSQLVSYRAYLFMKFGNFWINFENSESKDIGISSSNKTRKAFFPIDV